MDTDVAADNSLALDRSVGFLDFSTSFQEPSFYKYLDVDVSNVNQSILITDDISSGMDPAKNTERILAEIAELHDVEFHVGRNQTVLFGVKSILSSHSGVFKKLFSNRTKRKEHVNKIRAKVIWQQFQEFRQSRLKRRRKPERQIIELSDCDPEVFQQLLTFIQTRKAEVNMSNVIGLLAMSCQYEVYELQSVCVETIRAHLHTDNALYLLESTRHVTYQRWTKNIIREILDFIAERAECIFAQMKFDDIPWRTALLVFSKRSLKITEEQKWDAILRWTKRHCHRRGVSYFRRCVKLLCQRVDFTAIPVSKIIKEVQPLGVVPNDVIQNAIQNQRHNRIVIGAERPSPAPMKPPRRLYPKRSLKSLLHMSNGKLFGSYHVKPHHLKSLFNETTI